MVRGKLLACSGTHLNEHLSVAAKNNPLFWIKNKSPDTKSHLGAPPPKKKLTTHYLSESENIPQGLSGRGDARNSTREEQRSRAPAFTDLRLRGPQTRGGGGVACRNFCRASEFLSLLAFLRRGKVRAHPRVNVSISL